MDFVRASSNLIGGIRLDDLAREFGVTRGSVGQSRLAKTNPQYRRPPAGWEDVVAKLARKRATALTKLADRLSRASSTKKARPAAKKTSGTAKKTRRAASERTSAKSPAARKTAKRKPAKRKAAKRSRKG
jgi:hypothetical protein